MEDDVSKANVDEKEGNQNDAPSTPTMPTPLSEEFEAQGLRQRNPHHANLPVDVNHPQIPHVPSQPYHHHPPARRNQRTISIIDLFMVVVVFAIIAILVKKYVTMNH